MTKSILFLAFYFPPENASGAARSYRFYKYLQRFGYNICVLTACPQPEGQHNVICVSSQGARRKAVQSVVSRVLGGWIAEKSIRWAIAAEETANKLVSSNGDWIVYSTSEPVIAHIVGGRLKRRWRIPWIADFRDPLCGNPLRMNSLARRALDTLVERWTFSRADALIANTDTALEMWRARHARHAAKMHVVPNGFDPEDNFGPLPVSARDYKLLVHAGIVYGIRNPDVLFLSLRRLIRRGVIGARQVRVRMIGPLERGWVKDHDLADELVALGCLEYDGLLVSKSEAEEAIATADSLILLDSHEAMGGVQIPAKLYHYVRVGRPILTMTTRGSAVDRLLSLSGVPYVSIYPDDTPEDVDGKMIAFLNLPVEPVTASQWFWNTFAAFPQTRQLAALMASL